jgi:transcriptional regulator with XRE-family HTH domain
VSSDICVRLGERIRALRNEKGWTQFEMAERMGFDRSYIAEVETGKIEICLRNLEIVAETFGLEPHQLLKLPSKWRQRRQEMP